MARPLLPARSSSRLKLPVLAFFLIVVVVLVFGWISGGLAYRTDGRFVYGVSADGTPKHRLWDHGTGGMGTAQEMNAANTAINWVINKPSPIVLNNMAGVLTTNAGGGSRLWLQRWNGSSWSSEWDAGTAIANLASRRSFDIAYEETAGRAMVVYSTGTNPQFRVWNGSSWTDAANVLSTAEAGNIEWVELASRPGSDEIALLYAFADGAGGHSLKGIIWNGSGWGSQSTALETNLAYDLAAGDTKAFDAAYESSGDLLVVFGGDANNASSYVTKPAGAGWGTVTAMPTWSDESSVVDIDAEPASDRIAAVATSASQQDLQYAIWNGSSWVDSVANADTSMYSFPSWAGRMPISVGWVQTGASAKAVVVYADDAANAIHWKTWTTSGWIDETDWNPGHTMGYLNSITIDKQPGENRIMVSIGDTNGSLWAKTYDGTSWANCNGGVALTTTLSGSASTPFGFTYDRYVFTGLGNGTNPTNSTVSVGTTNVGVDSFTLQTNTGVDTLTGFTFAGNADFTSANATNVRVYRDDGSLANEWDASDTLLGTGSLSGTNVTFSGLNIGVTKTLTQYLILFDVAGTATDTELTGAVSSITVTNTALGADSAGSTVTINGTPPGQATGFSAGDGENAQSTLSWVNPTDLDFKGIRVLKRSDGTYPTGPNDPLAQNIFEDFVDPIATNYTDTGPLTNGSTYHYAVFTQDTGDAWNTLITEGVNADTGKPGPVVTLTNTAMASGTIYQGQTGIVMQKINLSTDYSTATLDSITVNRTGTGSDAGISSVRIYTDVNNNGAIDGSDAQIGSGSFAGGVAAISLTVQTIDTSAKAYLVVYDISNSASTSVTAGSNIVSQSSLGISGASRVNAFSNYGSNLLTIDGNIVTVTNTAVATTAFRGENNVVMERLGFSANYGTATLTAIQITKLGTILDSRVSSVKVYVDTNSNGTFDAGDSSIGSGSFSGGTLSVSLSPSQSLTTSVKYYFVTFDIGSNASAGDTVGARIASQGSVTVSSPDTIATFANYDSNLLTVTNTANQLGVGHTLPADFSAQQGTQDNIVDVIDLSVVQGNGVTMTGLRLDHIGTAVATDITSVKLYRDANSNGTFQAGIDPQISSTTISGGRADFSLSLDISKTASEKLFVAVSLTTPATVGATVQFNLANNSYITVNSPDTVASFAALSSAILTILDKPDILTVSQNAVDGGDIMVGHSDHVIQDLRLSVNEDKVTIKSLAVKRIGTALDSDTQASGIKLWYDADDNGFISHPDWQLSSSATFADGDVIFNDIKAMTVVDGSPKRFLITASTRLDAVIDRTLGCSVESAPNVAVGNPDTVTLISTPLSSLTHTLGPTAPSAPTGLNVIAEHNKRFLLEWNANNSSEYITKYKVFRAASGEDYVYVGETAASPYVDTVTATGVYSYKITAVNRLGESVRGAPARAESIEFQLTVPSTGDTTTIESSEGSLLIDVPPAYADKQLSVKTEAKPAGLSTASEHYYALSTNAAQPFDPPLTITLRCAQDVTEGTVLYHYTSAGSWVEVTGGNYTRNGRFITYDNITEFSGYVAADMTAIGGYNYPIINTDTPSGPHGQYTSASNRCKDCHAGHRALGMYRLTRADIRADACNFCHGISGAAGKTVILDANGHGIGEADIGKPVVAPGDTDPAYTNSSTMWGCLECHSVHDNQSFTPAGYSSNKLLKADPNPGKSYLYYTPVVGESTQTVSQWCSTCHNANFGASSDIENKLVPMGALTGRAAGHASSVAGTTTDTSGNIVISLDDTINNGPTCKECHPSDGGNPAVAAQFPHTSGSTRAMLKAGSSPIQVDNVCVGCHQTSSLN